MNNNKQYSKSSFVGLALSVLLHLVLLLWFLQFPLNTNSAGNARTISVQLAQNTQAQASAQKKPAASKSSQKEQAKKAEQKPKQDEAKKQEKKKEQPPKKQEQKKQEQEKQQAPKEEQHAPINNADQNSSNNQNKPKEKRLIAGGAPPKPAASMGTLDVKKNINTNKAESDAVPTAPEKPQLSKEPLANKEPSANEAPAANEEPLANKKPLAGKEPSAAKQQMADSAEQDKQQKQQAVKSAKAKPEKSQSAKKQPNQAKEKAQAQALKKQHAQLTSERGQRSIGKANDGKAKEGKAKDLASEAKVTEPKFTSSNNSSTANASAPFQNKVSQNKTSRNKSSQNKTSQVQGKPVHSNPIIAAIEAQKRAQQQNTQRQLLKEQWQPDLDIPSDFHKRFGNFESLTDSAMSNAHVPQPHSKRKSKELQLANRYIAIMNQQVRAAWRKPNVGNKPARGIVKFDLNLDGTIKDVWLYRSSGIQILDESAEAAIWAVAKFKVPQDARAFYRYYASMSFHFSSVKNKFELLPFEKNQN